MSGTIAMMIAASVALGAFGLFALLWGLKTRQFDDTKKFLDGALFDSEDALNDAYKIEQKQKQKGYKS
jgi:cytochrome oxidase maturation protein, cbb3-type